MIQSCFQQYRLISDTIDGLRSTDKDLSQFIVFLELSFSSLAEVLRLVDQVESSLDDSTKDVLRRVLLELQALLAKYTSKLSSCYHKDGKSPRRVKFAFGLKGDLEKLQTDIDTWNDRLTRRLFLRGISIALEQRMAGVNECSKATNPHQEYRESKASFLTAAESPIKGTLRRIDELDRYIGELPDGTAVVVEYRRFKNDASFQEKVFVKHSVRNIASMLRRAHARAVLFNSACPKSILSCAGYFEDETCFRYGLVSAVPSAFTTLASPRSLQNLLQSPENSRGLRHDLRDRVTLAQSIASAVLEIHSAGFVHKNIRPNNILIFESADPSVRKYPHRIGSAVVVGFDEARPDDEDSERIGTADWGANIYRHPHRQGINPRVRYSMLHDIYSLGVILIEIALWRSSTIRTNTNVNVNLNENNRHNPDFWGSLYDARREERDPEKIQALYKKLNKGVVAKHIGGRFAETIHNCLTCLDGEEGVDTGSECEIGVAYIEKVVELLESISL